MGNPRKKSTTPTTPQAVLEDAADKAAQIHQSAVLERRYTDLGEATKYALTIKDERKQAEYFRRLKRLRDVTEYDYFVEIAQPLTELQAATVTGDKAAADRAATKVVNGLTAFAEISPEFAAYVKGLEDRIAKLETRMDKVEEETRARRIEEFLAAKFPGEFSPLPPTTGGATPTKPYPAQPTKNPQPITDAASLAQATGATYEAPRRRNILQRALDAIRLGSDKNSSEESGYPGKESYWVRPSASAANNADNGANRKE